MAWDTIKLSLWTAVGIAIAVLGIGLQFRGPFAQAVDLTWSASGARWLMALAAGGLLGWAGCKLPEAATAPHRWLAVGAGAALGGALGWRWFDPAAAVIGAALLAIAFAWLAHRIRGTYLSALACLLFTVVGFFSYSLVKFDPNIAKSLAAWGTGDTSHATWITAGIALIVLIATLSLGQRANPWLAAGVAIGLAGPLAFVAWWVPRAEARLAGLQGTQRLVLCALAGGVLVATTDAMQRYFVGGYGLGLNLPLTMFGLPFLLWWAGARVAAAAVLAFAATFSFYAVQVIQSAT